MTTSPRRSRVPVPDDLPAVVRTMISFARLGDALADSSGGPWARPRSDDDARAVREARDRRIIEAEYERQRLRGAR